MVFTTKFKVLLGVVAGLLVAGGLTFNQYTLQKELTDQVKLDTKVMKADQKVWAQLEKVASEGAKAKVTVSPTPTPKLLATPKGLTSK